MPVLTMRRPRVVGVVGSLVAGSLLLAACSGGASDSNGDGNDSTSTKLINSMPAAKGEVDSFTWNLSNGEPDTIDPGNAAWYPSGTVVSNMCDSLLQMDADFSLKPNLASYELVDPTTLVWTVRDDATFWNGNPVTAEDVAYSMNRIFKDPAKTVNFMYINVDTIKVTGKQEVTVTFKTPDELFVREMANVSGAVMEKASSQKLGKRLGTPQGGVMCSGPLKFASWKSGDSISLERNDDYWNADRRAFAKQVTFTFITDATALTQALNAGEIDGANEIPASAIPALKKSSAGTLTFGPSVQTTALFVARPDGPLADVKLREAFNTLVDRQTLADKVFNGAAKPNYAIVSQQNWPAGGKDVYAAGYKTWEEARSLDAEKSKKLVESSSYDGETVVVAFQAGDDAMSRTAQFVQQQAKAAGITVEVKAVQPLQFGQALYDASAREGIDFLLSSSFNAAPDPNEPMGFILLPGQPYNYTDYDDPEVTQLLEQSRSEYDEAASAEAFVKAQDMYEKSSLATPLLSTNTVTFLNDRLTGAVTSFAYWSMPSMAFIGSAK